MTWVVDTKRYRGKVERRDVGGWRQREDRLFVAGRDRTGLVEQVLSVASLVDQALGDLAARPVLCFVDGDWGLFSRPFEVGGVLVTWPKALASTIEGSDILAGRVAETADRLARGFPPAA